MSQRMIPPKMLTMMALTYIVNQQTTSKIQLQTKNIAATAWETYICMLNEIYLSRNVSKHLGVRRDDPEGLSDLLDSGSASNIQEVGGSPSVQLNNVHRRHGKTSTIYCTHTFTHAL